MKHPTNLATPQPAWPIYGRLGNQYAHRVKTKPRTVRSMANSLARTNFPFEVPCSSNYSRFSFSVDFTGLAC